MPIHLTPIAQAYARYKASAGKLAYGVPGGETGEISLAGLHLAIDVENSLPGWLRITDNGSDFVAGIHNQPPPPVPGPDYVYTLSLLFSAPDALGDTIFRICDVSMAYLRFAQELFNQCEPHFGRGQIPFVKITGTPVHKTRNGASTNIVFEVEKWIDRPVAFNEAIASRDASMALRKAKPGSDYAVISGHDSEYSRTLEPPPNDAPPVGEEDINSEVPF